MPSPSALEQWATEQYAETATFFNDPDSMDDWQIQLHTGESKQSISIIQRLLKDELDASGAASDIARMCQSRLVPNKSVQAPQGLWLVLCRAIERFADDEAAASRKKLAGLLVELSKIDVRDASGNPVKMEEGREVFWSELPGWVLAWRDNMTGVPDRGSYEDRSDYITNWQRRFQSGNLFQAHWLAQVGQTGPHRFYNYATVIAREHLREALETTTEDTPLGRRRTELYVAGILPWITEAGSSLLQLCRAEYGRDGSKVFSPPGSDEGVVEYAFVGDDGFHMERWGVWKAALDRVAGLEGISPEVARGAADAAKEMDRLEL
ncbi:hypothetical protein PG993_003598 [Apiospora rasikravindrae]|uniref:Uncharacterized protein n=1 Tax=Apiospora rasikravindrae TaxID=990691 RepID=A0ABR1TZZ3_9PEZI